VIGASWTLTSTLVALVAGVILNPVLVLYLGVDGYGVWATAIAIASLIGLGGDLGVAGALTKFVAERRGQGKDIESLAGSALAFGLLAGVAAGVVLAGISLMMTNYLGYSQFPLLLQFQAAQMPFNLGTSSLMAILQGKRQFRTLAFFAIAQSAGGLVGSVGLLVAGQGLPGVMTASLVTSALLFFALLFFSRREVRYHGPDAFRSDFRRLVSFGIPLTAGNALSTVVYQIDLVALSFLIRTPAVVGAYALAVFITRGLWILPSSISATTYPVISEYSAAKENDRVSRYLSTALAASVALTGILATGLVLFGRPILQLVFGPNALAAYDYALVLLFGTAIVGALRAVAPSLPAIGRPEIGLRISLLSAAILTSLAFAMTSALGAMGTSLAVSITFTLNAIVLAWAIDRYVLMPKPGLTTSPRIARSAGIALATSSAAVLFAFPAVTTLTQVAAGVIFLTATSAILLKVSGGRDTWGTFFGRSQAVSVERG